MLDVYLVRPESLVHFCTIEQGISDYCGMLLEVEWEENYYRPEEESLVTVYNKTNILGLVPSSGGKKNLFKGKQR
jgi:hypothetical protein